MDPLLEQLLTGFVDESQEIYERVTRNLIELENAPAQGTRFDDLARGLHTLKGSAATLGLEELADLAHRMEDAILPLRGSAEPLPQPLADAVLKSLDAWMARLRATAAKTELPDLQPALQLLTRQPPVERPEVRVAEPAPETEEPQTAEETSWRVSTRQVIALLHEVERLREVRLRIDERRREIDRAAQQLGPATDARASLLNLRRALGTDSEEAADIVSSMEDGLKAISTMPVRTVIEPLRRAVRDLCKATGKLARLSVVGAEVSLDRRVLEQLRGPLVHLVR
ncbi:MAG: Hpt domain-containing protein, partial [Myxococcales bacterium]|nr:Hpt domain-containing protein [Myxococcales bacterium]